MGGSDVPPFLPPRFVAFARRYHRCARVRSAGVERDTGGLGLISEVPVSDHRWKRLDLPGSWGTPCARAVALRPRRDLRAWPQARHVGAGFRLIYSVASRRQKSLGAQSRGSRTPCVRFAAGIAPGPRNTRFRPVANRCRAGVGTRRVPIRGFSFSGLLPPLPGLSWRTNSYFAPNPGSSPSPNRSSCGFGLGGRRKVGGAGSSSASSG